jgi:hypothetical protein
MSYRKLMIAPPLAQITVLANNGLHQTGRGGVAVRSMRPVVEARPAGEPGCSTGFEGRRES